MIIADTGFFLAIANQKDKHHKAAISALAEVSEPLVTTWPVLMETCHLLLYRLGNTSLLAFIRSAQDSAFIVTDISQDHLTQISKLMKKYQDLPMDLADASLVVLAEEINDGRILSTDNRDFKTYRWKNRKPFTNLLLT